MVTADPSATPSATAARSPLSGVLRFVLERYALVTVLVLMVVIFGLLEPDTFLSSGNLQTILSSQAVLMIVTLGIVLSLSVGEFDLSAGFTVAFAGTVLGKLTIESGVPVGLAVLITLLAGLAVGAVNAFLVVGLRVNSFIATLGTGTILGGLSLALSDSMVLSGVPEPLVDAMRAQVLGLPLPVFYGLACAVVIWILLEHTTGGRRLVFTGLGADAAKLSGVRTGQMRSLALIGGAGIAALAGIVLTGRMGAADPTAGADYLLPAFAGAFLGATAFKPGRFNAWGAVIALYVLVTGITGLQLIGAASWVEPVFNGTALVIAVALSQLTARRRTTA